MASDANHLTDHSPVDWISLCLLGSSLVRKEAGVNACNICANFDFAQFQARDARVWGLTLSFDRCVASSNVRSGSNCCDSRSTRGPRDARPRVDKNVNACTIYDRTLALRQRQKSWLHHPRTAAPVNWRHTSRQVMCMPFSRVPALNPWIVARIHTIFRQSAQLPSRRHTSVRPRPLGRPGSGDLARSTRWSMVAPPSDFSVVHGGITWKTSFIRECWSGDYGQMWSTRESELQSVVVESITWWCFLCAACWGVWMVCGCDSWPYQHSVCCWPCVSPNSGGQSSSTKVRCRGQSLVAPSGDDTLVLGGHCKGTWKVAGWR